MTLLIPSSILGGASRDESAGISDGGYRPAGNPLHEHKGNAQPLKKYKCNNPSTILFKYLMRCHNNVAWRRWYSVTKSYSNTGFVISKLRIGRHHSSSCGIKVTSPLWTAFALHNPFFLAARQVKGWRTRVVMTRTAMTSSECDRCLLSDHSSLNRRNVNLEISTLEGSQRNSFSADVLQSMPFSRKLCTKCCYLI